MSARRLSRAERRRHAVQACVRLAHTDPVTYDELADAGELRQNIVDAVDARIDEEGAA